MPWILGVVLALFALIAVVLFSAGEDLFGSDPGTIDEYNSGTIESCELPAESTLVQVSVAPILDESGRRYRSMSYVYASPFSPEDVAEHFGVSIARSTPVASARACRFGQRPSVVVVALDDVGTSGRDDVWADPSAEVRMSTDVPAGTRSLFRLRLAQREVEGIF